jgi:class 3 adenylate cyclase
MAKETATRAIVFADISGSTRLYETLGDAIARELVSQCLDLMTEQVNRHNGAVIKTIGDEIMATFATAEQAVEACMSMQEAVAEDLPSVCISVPAYSKAATSSAMR